MCLVNQPLGIEWWVFLCKHCFTLQCFKTHCRFLLERSLEKSPSLHQVKNQKLLCEVSVSSWDSYTSFTFSIPDNLLLLLQEFSLCIDSNCYVCLVFKCSLKSAKVNNKNVCSWKEDEGLTKTVKSFSITNNYLESYLLVLLPLLLAMA